MASSTDQLWLHQYPLMEELSDATMVAKTPTSHHLSPKGMSSISKSRKSRATKRTPTTLLSANTTNFRALVQQFTGCPTTTMSSFGVHKGPITLNFKDQVVHPKTTSRSFNNYNQVHVHHHHHHQVLQTQAEQAIVVPQQQQQEEESVGYNNFYRSSTSSSGISSGMEVSDHDGFLMEADYDFSGLHDLINMNNNYAFSGDIYSG